MLDLWSTMISGDDRDYIDEILQASPSKLYHIAAGAFDSLRVMAISAMDGMLHKDKGAEASFYSDIEIPMYAIIAYCDTNTNIDTSCIIELLHAIHAEITTIKVFGGGHSIYGPKRDREKFEHLKYQLWITNERLGNHLYSIMSQSQRVQVQNTLDDSEKWSQPIPCKVLRKIFARDGIDISQETLLSDIEKGIIKIDSDRSTTRNKIVLKSCMPAGWESFLRKKQP